MSIQEAKAQLSIAEGDDTHNSELLSFIAAAREEWERDTSTALIERTIQHRMPAFQQITKLTVLPVVSITSVKYMDTDGVEQTVSSAEYYLDIDEVRFFDTYTFPDTQTRSEAVRITYVAGYGDEATDCPELDRMAIKLSLANRFENRDMIVSANYTRQAYEALVAKKMRASYP